MTPLDRILFEAAVAVVLGSLRVGVFVACGLAGVARGVRRGA